VQARLADPARRAHLDQHGRQRLRREGAVRHLLSGIARCGVCGARMMVGNNRGSKSYHCKQSFHTARREDLTDQVVIDIILARLNQPDILDLLTDNDQDTTVRDAVAEAEQKRARLETFIDAAADGSITAAALARIEAKLMAEIDAAFNGHPQPVCKTGGTQTWARWGTQQIPEESLERPAPSLPGPCWWYSPGDRRQPAAPTLLDGYETPNAAVVGQGLG
jgi:hypothetical protein